MSWFEEQIQARWRLDEEQLENAYARLASSVMGKGAGLHFSVDDAMVADTAIDAVMAFYGTKPADVPEDITDPLERIDYAVRPTGVMRRAVNLEGSWWKDATGAYLAMLEDGTPVAVIPSGLRGYCYVDPVTRRKVRVNKSTAKNLETDALCFYRPLPQRELTLRDVIAFMFHSLDWGDWALVVAAGIVSTVIGLLPAIANQLLFSRIIPSGVPALIFPIAALLLGLTLSQALINITRSVIVNRLNIKLRTQMEAATFARVMLLPPSFFKEYAAGDLATRTMGMNGLVDTLSQTILGAGLTSLFSLAYIGQLFVYAPQLVVPAVVAVFAEVGATLIALRATVAYNRQEMKARTKLGGLTPALFHGIQKIKIAGAERRAFAHWANSYGEMTQKTYGRPALLLAAPSLIPLIASVGTIVLYYLAATTQVSLANYMAFNTAFGSVSGAIITLSGTTTLMATLRPILELVEPIIKSVPETVSNQRQITSVTGGIEISNLSFRYNEKSPLVLNDISLRIRPREYVAIVGRTGCGKSTLMRLLLGFERPSKGAIYYNGQDISSVDIRSLRRNIGVVMQSGTLFQGDLYMNITVANPKATLDDAWEAAEMAGVADDIRKMPMGMQTIVSEGGGGVSGGQRQRILIARAICGKPRIVMLDEATSALDNKTQKHVSDSLSSLKCTRVVIAHRLSTIRHADRIIMIDEGKIVEEGNYDELIARNGLFADLVRRQRLEEE